MCPKRRQLTTNQRCVSSQKSENLICQYVTGHVTSDVTDIGPVTNYVTAIGTVTNYVTAIGHVTVL